MVFLEFQIECLDCNHSEQFELDAKALFKEDGDYMGNFVNQRYFCNRICSRCKNFIYISYRKLYKPDEIKKLSSSTEWKMGCKKSKIKIHDMMP